MRWPSWLLRIGQIYFGHPIRGLGYSYRYGGPAADSVRLWNDLFVEEQIDHTVLVLAPWDDPIPLTQAWCLWEIYSTLCCTRKSWWAPRFTFNPAVLVGSPARW